MTVRHRPVQAAAALGVLLPLALPLLADPGLQTRYASPPSSGVLSARVQQVLPKGFTVNASVSCQVLLKPNGRAERTKCGVFKHDQGGVGQLIGAAQSAIERTKFQPASIGDIPVWSVLSIQISHRCASTDGCRIHAATAPSRDQSDADAERSLRTTAQEISADGRTWVDRLRDHPVCDGEQSPSPCHANSLYSLTPIAHIDNEGLVREVGLARGSYQRLPQSLHGAIVDTLMDTRFLPARDASGARVASVMPVMAMIGTTTVRTSAPLCLTPPLTGSRLPDLDCQPAPDLLDDGSRLRETRVSWLRLPSEARTEEDADTAGDPEAAWLPCALLDHGVRAGQQCAVPALPKQRSADGEGFPLTVAIHAKRPARIRVLCSVSVTETGITQSTLCWEGAERTGDPGDLAAKDWLRDSLKKALNRQRFSAARLGRKHVRVLVQLQARVVCEGNGVPCASQVWLHHGPNDWLAADRFIAAQGVTTLRGDTWVNLTLRQVLCSRRNTRSSQACIEPDALRMLFAEVDLTGELLQLGGSDGTEEVLLRAPRLRAVDEIRFIPAQSAGHAVRSKTSYIASAAPVPPAEGSAQ